MIDLVALYVVTGGVYFGLPNVEPWDRVRDARKYDGQLPAIAHPPCDRWGRYWGGGPSVGIPKRLGDDGGMFAHAFKIVGRNGGVIEHPEASHAWHTFNINRPPRDGGWVHGGLAGGWTCCVEQGHYGHAGRKPTWLWYVGKKQPPDLVWGPAEDKMRLEDGFHTNEERHAARAAGVAPVKRLSHREREGTPIPFRDMLISLVRGDLKATAIPPVT